MFFYQFNIHVSIFLFLLLWQINDWPPYKLNNVVDVRHNTLYHMNNKDNYQMFRWIDNNVIKIVSPKHTGQIGDDVAWPKKILIVTEIVFAKTKLCVEMNIHIQYQNINNCWQLQLLDVWYLCIRSINYLLLPIDSMSTNMDAYSSALLQCPPCELIHLI